MAAREIELKTLLICFAAVLSVEMAMRVVVSEHLFPPMIVLGGARLLETILIALVVIILGSGLSTIGVIGSQIVSGLKKGLTWSAGFGLVACFAFLALLFLGMKPLTLVRTPLPSDPSEITFFFIVGGFVAPVAEEVFFRGVLYGFFRRWGIISAIVLSTSIFVLVHTFNRGLPITQVIGGIAFALAYEVEGSLMVPITIHALGNTAIFTLSLVS